MTNPVPAEEELVRAPHAPLADYYNGEQGRRTFVRQVFDETAGDYDRIEKLMAFGTGPWYRRRALVRSGLAKGMDVLDVAVGTGLVAREAVAVVGDARKVVGVDPSIGMLRSSSKPLDIVAVQGMAESLPFVGDRFDFLSMGFAMRHMSDLAVVFAEFHRVLKPGGTVCILEITKPKGALAHGALRAYMRGLVPFLARFAGRHRDTAHLFKYFWDTIEACVPPEAVIAALRHAGFTDVKRGVELGIFSEYTGRKAGGPVSRASS
jgi:demethylmenaquinone methyltransferase/2-methoxy-6-polyprenyl-1,4-benzoquinol methylase